jgi:Icc-related predicted phosphoesterase
LVICEKGKVFGEEQYGSALMQALFFSDLHGDKHAITRITDQLKKVEVGFGLGDFASFGRGLIETLEPLLVGRDVYFVPGNHDDADELKWLCQEHEDCHYLHADHVTLGNRTFAGLGGGLPGLPFGVTEERVHQILRSFYYLENLILCTHTPPYGTAVDITWGGTHIGYRALRDFVTEVQPIAVYSGHVHEAEGKTDRLGTTELKAVGPYGQIVDI